MGFGQRAADLPQQETALPPIDITSRPPDKPVPEAVAEEARKGYDFLMIGIEPLAEEGVFDDRLAAIAAEFEGPIAITAARGRHRRAGVRRRSAATCSVTRSTSSRPNSAREQSSVRR